jgi:hypothetical protein
VCLPLVHVGSYWYQSTIMNWTQVPFREMMPSCWFTDNAQLWLCGSGSTHFGAVSHCHSLYRYLCKCLRGHRGECRGQTLEWLGWLFLMFHFCVKGKGNPLTGPGGPIGWVEIQLKSFLTSALEGGVWSASRPGRLYPRERPVTHCTGGWVGPGAGLDRCGKSRPTGIRSMDLPARSKSLYWLSYPSSLHLCVLEVIYTTWYKYEWWGFQPLGIWRWVIWWVVPDVSEAPCSFVKEERDVLHTIKWRKGNWTDRVLHWYCLLKHVIYRQVEGRNRSDGKMRKKT